MTEYFDVLDEQGALTGTSKPRKEVHRDGDWHACVHIWIYSQERDEQQLQLRHPKKDTFGDYLDTSVAGHLSAGNMSDEAAYRELEEELGLKGRVLIRVGRQAQVHTFVSPVIGHVIDNEWATVYFVEGDVRVEDIAIQAIEVSGVAWVKREDFFQYIRSGDDDAVVKCRVYSPVDSEGDSLRLSGNKYSTMYKRVVRPSHVEEYISMLQSYIDALPK